MTEPSGDASFTDDPSFTSEPALADEPGFTDESALTDESGFDEEPASAEEPAFAEQPDAGDFAAEAAVVTGHPVVDGALAQLDAVADRVPAEQVGAFEAVHRALTGTLSGIDQS